MGSGQIRFVMRALPPHGQVRGGSDQIGSYHIRSDQMGSNQIRFAMRALPPHGQVNGGSDQIGSDQMGSDRIRSDGIGSDGITDGITDQPIGRSAVAVAHYGEPWSEQPTRHTDSDSRAPWASNWAQQRPQAAGSGYRPDTERIQPRPQTAGSGYTQTGYRGYRPGCSERGPRALASSPRVAATSR